MSRRDDDFADKLADGLFALWYSFCGLIFTAMLAGLVSLTDFLLSTVNQATNGALERNRIMGVIISAAIFLVGCSLLAPIFLAITGLQIAVNLFWPAIIGTIIGIVVGIRIMFGDGNEIASIESTGDFTDVLELPPELYTPIPEPGVHDGQTQNSGLSLADIETLFAYPSKEDAHVEPTGGSNGYNFG